MQTNSSDQKIQSASKKTKKDTKLNVNFWSGNSESNPVKRQYLKTQIQQVICFIRILMKKSNKLWV